MCKTPQGIQSLQNHALLPPVPSGLGLGRDEPVVILKFGLKKVTHIITRLHCFSSLRIFLHGIFMTPFWYDVPLQSLLDDNKQGVRSVTPFKHLIQPISIKWCLLQAYLQGIWEGFTAGHWWISPKDSRKVISLFVSCITVLFYKIGVSGRKLSPSVTTKAPVWTLGGLKKAERLKNSHHILRKTRCKWNCHN